MSITKAPYLPIAARVAGLVRQMIDMSITKLGTAQDVQYRRTVDTAQGATPPDGRHRGAKPVPRLARNSRPAPNVDRSDALPTPRPAGVAPRERPEWSARPEWRARASRP